MKERLVELLRKKEDDFTITCPRYEEGATLINCIGCKYDMEDGSCDYASREADYLLDNGVIVPPCKVGDKVYHIRETTCENIDGLYTICEFYRHSGDNLCALPKGKCPNKYRIAECCVSRDNLLIVTEKWGKTVFLTREQAQAKLKEGGKE